MATISAPFEILAAPLTLYLAPVGTAFPAIDAPEPFIGPWVKIGTQTGSNNYADAGVTVTHNQTLATFTPVGTTAALKVWRTDEKLDIGIQLADISPAQYAQILNNVTVTSVVATTGVAGHKSFPLLGGIQVATFALVARGLSAINDALNAQYALPAVYQSANPAPVFKKGTPAELALTFTTLLDPAGGGFGVYDQQSTVHL